MDRYGDCPELTWVDAVWTPLAQLLSTNDPALAQRVERVLEQLDQPIQALAAFGNAPLPR
jgi:hypothetical protein